MKKTLLLLAVILSAVTASIAQSRFITRGAEEGELYMSTNWYRNYGFFSDTVYRAFLHITENGKKVEITHSILYQSPNVFIADTLPMQADMIIADAKPGVLYNIDWYMTYQASENDRLWFSDDYGKTWELRDKQFGRSNYFAANVKGVIYRGGGGVYKSIDYAQNFSKIDLLPRTGGEPGLVDCEFYKIMLRGFQYTNDCYMTCIVESTIDSEYVYGNISGFFPDVFRGGKAGEVYITSGFPDDTYKVSFSADTGYHFRVVHQRQGFVDFMTDRKPGDFYIVTQQSIETQYPSGRYNRICIEHYTDYGETLVDIYCHDLMREGVITSTAEIQDNNEIIVYPNPTTGKIQVTNDGLQVTGIEVFDLLGRKVLEQNTEGKTQCEVDMSKLPAGIYFVRIQTEKEATTQKIVKQ